MAARTQYRQVFTNRPTVATPAARKVIDGPREPVDFDVIVAHTRLPKPAYDVSGATILEITQAGDRGSNSELTRLLKTPADYVEFQAFLDTATDVIVMNSGPNQERIKRYTMPDSSVVEWDVPSDVVSERVRKGWEPIYQNQFRWPARAVVEAAGSQRF